MRLLPQQHIKDRSSSEREHRRRSCGTKIQFLSELEALRRLITLPDPAYMHAYCCEFCECWHIGHKTNQRFLKVADASNRKKQNMKLDEARKQYQGIVGKLATDGLAEEKRANLETTLKRLVNKYTFEALQVTNFDMEEKTRVG